MNRYAVAARETLRLMVAGMERDAATVVRRLSATHPDADSLIALYVIDQMLDRRERWTRGRMIVDDWTPGMVNASQLFRARMCANGQGVNALLRQVSCMDVLEWAARVVRETTWLERTTRLPLAAPDPEPDPDPCPPPVEPPVGGWIQRSQDWAQ